MTRAREVVAAALAVAVAAGGWVAVSSRPGLRPTGCLRGCATGPRSPGPLRVVGLNLLHGFPRFAHLDARIGLVAAEIRRLDADLVLLEEVPWTPGTGSVATELARRTGLNDAYLRANGNRRAILFEEGEAILSRFPIRDPAGVRLPAAPGLFEHRVALAATVDTDWGPVRAVVGHLSGGSPTASAAQAAALRRFVGAPAEPVLVGGDVNAGPDSAAVRALARDWTDLLAAASPADTGPTCCVGDLTAAPGSPLADRIDFLWLAGTGGRVVAAHRILTDPVRVGAGWLRASDHAGLFAAVDLSR